MRSAQTAGSPPAAAPALPSELLAFERLLAELSADFVGLPAERIDGAIEDALRRIVQTLHVDRASLTQVSPLTGRIVLTHTWAESGVPSAPVGLDSGALAPWALAKARAGEPIVFARLDDLPAEAEADRHTYARIGLKSHVTMPMHVAGQLQAGLSIGAVRCERVWPEPLLGRLRLLADMLAAVLARAQAEAQRERALDFERLASRILGALLVGGARDDAAIVEAGLREIAGFLGADRVTLWEYSRGAGVFQRTHYWYATGLPMSEAWQVAQMPWIAARLDREALVRFARRDQLPPAAAGDLAVLDGLGVRSLLALPVAVQGDLVGAFTVAAVQRECDWPDALLPGLRLLAEVFATLHVRRGAEARKRAAEAEAALWRERFAHVVRVHTMGEMSAALAHEITQPLGAIENYALAARRRAAAEAPDMAKVLDLLDRVVAQAARAGDVVTRLRSMVKRHELQTAEVDLDRVVRSCIELLRGDCDAAGLAVEVQHAAALPPVLADEVHVQQVLLNLLRNAIEAMATAPSGAPRLIRVALGRSADAASVQVIDHGHGIADGDLEQVFEAFHSTKPLGLGVGLAICRRLIEAHGGTLRAAHHPGGGAAFTFTLPLPPAEA